MFNKERKTAREKIDERKAKENKKKRMNFSDTLIDLKRNPFIAIGLIGSGILTALSGLFIGIAPKLDANGVLSLFGGVSGWGAVIFGSFFGILYMVAFPTIGEVGTYYWHRKAALRDEGNTTQAVIAFGMLGLTFAFMVTTAIAASVILASLLHTFEAFEAIPPWAQKWTILVIPIALAIHAGMNMWYDHVSAYAEERREMERDLQQTEMVAEQQMREARINFKKKTALAMADAYDEYAEGASESIGKQIAREAFDADRREMTQDENDNGISDWAEKSYPTPPRSNGRHPVPVHDDGDYHGDILDPQ